MVDTKFKKGLVPWNKGTTGIMKSNITSFKKGQHISTKTEFKKGLVSWNKGKHPSEETIKKQSKSWMKTYLSHPEMRKKMSESHKGQTAWNKGIPMSKESRKKMSESRKGKTPWNKGKKIGFIPKGAFKKGHVPWIKGKSSHNKGKHLSEEIKRKIGSANLGKHRTEEFRKKMSEFKKGKKYPGTSERRREIILERYESGNFPLQTNTKPERQIKEELLKRGYNEGIDFIHQYKFMNKFMCDFCFPQQRVIVEVYGDFWHCNPKIYTGKKLFQQQIRGINKDKSKEAYITKVDNHSWTYLVHWESDIEKDVSKCVDKIEEVLDEKIK